MNILLNFYPVQSGGGQQVASNFLRMIAKESFSHNWYVFVGVNSELHMLATELLPKECILAIPYSYSNRLKSRRQVSAFCREKQIDIIYNYSTVLAVPGVRQVVRSVYSNLYFPEIDFWKDYPFLMRMRKKVIDHFRLKGTLRADGLVFENESMQERSASLFRYPQKQTVYIEPSVTEFDRSRTSSDYDHLADGSRFRILYLSSWHLNKNMQLLPQVARLLKDRGIDLQFVLTIDRNHPDVVKHLINQVAELDVEAYFECVGKVPAMHVHQLVSSSNAMILLSKLECFSSNVVEAYYFQKPLIISNEPWATAACKQAALYVDRDNPAAIADAIVSLVEQSAVAQELVAKGVARLGEFNTPFEKVAKQVAFLETVRNMKL